MNKIQKAYYILTAYVPRKLPTTEEGFNHLKKVVVEAYGVRDDVREMTVLVGQITSTHPNKIRRSYGHMANACKRLTMNALARCYQIACEDKLKEVAAEKMKIEAGRSTESTEDSCLAPIQEEPSNVLEMNGTKS